MSFKHFTLEARERLEHLLRKKYKKTEIASILGVSRSAVNQEIKRNSNSKGQYIARIAHNKAVARRKAASKLGKMRNEKIVKYIQEKLKLLWSPEQIARRMSIDFSDVSISFKTIYRWLRNGSYAKKGTIFTHYAKYLRIKSAGKRLRRSGNNIKHGELLSKKLPSIENRVDDKSVIGHWEADLVQGFNRSGYLLTLVDRKSGFTFIRHCVKKSVACVNVALESIYDLLPKKYLKTVTFDRGKEFYGYEAISKKYNIDCFFCHPSSPQERGLNENTNGLIRQFFPRKRDFSTITLEEINRATALLNHRPKKKHNFKTTVEVLKSWGDRWLYRLA